MKEEINLREIIESVWNGKWIIAVLTIIAMLISGIVSFFIIEPTYEAISTIRLGNNGEGQVAGQQLYLNSYAESVRTDVAISRLIEKLKLDIDKYSINSIRN